MEQPAIRLIHWYDVDAHRSACGAVGQSNSSKHVRAVTCSACLALVPGARAVPASEPCVVH